MKPILITLLIVPAIVFVVAAAYLRWHKASLVPSTRRRLLSCLMGASLVLAPAGVWYGLSTARSDLDVWMSVYYGLLWTCAIVVCARRHRNEYKQNSLNNPS